MGKDYDGIGGVGIALTEERIDKLIEKGIFTKEEWDNDYLFCIESKIKMIYSVGGNSYIGEDRLYLKVPGYNLKAINENKKDFIEKLHKVGIEITEEDILEIADIRVW